MSFEFSVGAKRPHETQITQPRQPNTPLEAPQGPSLVSLFQGSVALPQNTPGRPTISIKHRKLDLSAPSRPLVPGSLFGMGAGSIDPAAHCPPFLSAPKPFVPASHVDLGASSAHSSLLSPSALDPFEDVATRATRRAAYSLPANPGPSSGASFGKLLSFADEDETAPLSTTARHAKVESFLANAAAAAVSSEPQRRRPSIRLRVTTTGLSPMPKSPPKIDLPFSPGNKDAWDLSRSFSLDDESVPMSPAFSQARSPIPSLLARKPSIPMSPTILGTLLEARGPSVPPLPGADLSAKHQEVGSFLLASEPALQSGNLQTLEMTKDPDALPLPEAFAGHGESNKTYSPPSTGICPDKLQRSISSSFVLTALAILERKTLREDGSFPIVECEGKKGKHSQLYAIAGDRPLRQGIRNKDSYVKIFREKVLLLNGDVVETRFLRNSLTQYDAVKQAGLPSIQIYNRDTARVDAYLHVEKVVPLIKKVRIEDALGRKDLYRCSFFDTPDHKTPPSLNPFPWVKGRQITDLPASAKSLLKQLRIFFNYAFNDPSIVPLDLLVSNFGYRKLADQTLQLVLLDFMEHEEEDGDNFKMQARKYLVNWARGNEEVYRYLCEGLIGVDDSCYGMLNEASPTPWRFDPQTLQRIA